MRRATFEEWEIQIREQRDLDALLAGLHLFYIAGHWYAVLAAGNVACQVQILSR
jgi:hypothetical protein